MRERGVHIEVAGVRGDQGDGARSTASPGP